MFKSRQSLVLLLAFSLALPVSVGLVSLATAAGHQKKAEGPPEARPAEEQPEQNRFYDASNPDHQKLQKANEALAGFPVDKKGYVDWMKAKKSGIITPRSGLENAKPLDVLDLDVVMKNTREMPYVTFPHNSHTQWLSCANCHDEIFVPKAGANPISMSRIFEGKDCGVCHDKVAFITFFSCERCHNVPHGNVKSWW